VAAINRCALEALKAPATESSGIQRIRTAGQVRLLVSSADRVLADRVFD